LTDARAEPLGRPLVVAVPKGRILKPLVALLGRAGVEAAGLLSDDRSLVRDCGGLRFLLLKPDDVPTYVEYGAADLGVCGRDVLDEREPDVYRPLDLGIGVCRLVVAGPIGAAPPGGRPRVATKYPRSAAAHFGARGVQPEIVYVQGSVELAPVTGLADVIVDIVETGTTLAENGLAVVETVKPVSTALIANRVSYKYYAAEVRSLVRRLEGALGAPG
jgi:ATP phosphoribosyltransferase